jgi:hypothetical protein
MKNPFSLIAAASLVGLVIGFILGGQRESDTSRAAANAQTAESRPTRSADRSATKPQESSGDELLSSLLKGRAVQELSSTELSKILAQLTTFDRNQDPLTSAKQNYQLQLLLRKISPARLKEVAESLLKDPESKQNMGSYYVIASLSARDPQGAMAWAKSQPNPERLMAMILSNTAKDDPTGAAEVLRAGLMDGSFNSNDIYSTTYSVTGAMAKLGKDSLLAFLDSLPSQLQNNSLHSAIRELPEGEQSAVLDELYQRSLDGRMENYSFSNLLLNSSLPPAKIQAWLATLKPGEGRTSLELTYASSLFRSGKTEIAQDALSRTLAQNSGKEKEVLLKALGNTYSYRPGDIEKITSLLPPGVEIKADDLKNQSNSPFYNGFDSLLTLTHAIQDPAEKAKLLTTSFQNLTKSIEESSRSSRLNANDFAIAESQIAALKLSPEDAAAAQAALAAAKAAKPKNNSKP